MANHRECYISKNGDFYNSVEEFCYENDIELNSITQDKNGDFYDAEGNHVLTYEPEDDII